MGFRPPPCLADVAPGGEVSVQAALVVDHLQCYHLQHYQWSLVNPCANIDLAVKVRVMSLRWRKNCRSVKSWWRHGHCPASWMVMIMMTIIIIIIATMIIIETYSLDRWKVCLVDRSLGRSKREGRSLSAHIFLVIIIRDKYCFQEKLAGGIQNRQDYSDSFFANICRQFFAGVGSAGWKYDLSVETRRLNFPFLTGHKSYTFTFSQVTNQQNSQRWPHQKYFPAKHWNFHPSLWNQEYTL